MNWDTQWLLELNGQWSPWWDRVWLWITGQQHWWWLYALLILWIFYRLPFRKALSLIVLLIIAISLNDQLINLVKHATGRLRPCNRPDLRPLLHVLKCTTQKSFFSAHAANSFLLVSALWFGARKAMRTGLLGLLAVWALALSYSRLYVGVHYPSDILAGIAEGILAGLLVAVVFRRLTGSGS